MKKYLLFLGLFFFSASANSQVIISLLLGDKLNSGKIEFGLDGGVNFSTLDGVNGSSSTTGFHLGFYFDIKLKNDWLLNTGVIVKSPLGASGIAPYLLNNPELDTAFIGGEVTRNLRYFNVPLMIKRVFHNHLFAEGGIQLGLLYKAFDEFSQEVNEPEDLKYEISIREQYHALDAGLVAGIGYRLMKGNGMNISVRYYLGLVDIDESDPHVYNRSLYLAAGIPIGAGKAKEKREKKN